MGLKKKIGIIGYGSMGSMLLNGLLATKTVSPENAFVATRTPERLSTLLGKYPEVNVGSCNNDVARKADCLFICVKPADYPVVINEINSAVNREKHVVSITGNIRIESLEASLDCQVSKIMPTVTSEVYEGITLVCHGQRVSRANIEFLEMLMKSFGSIYPVVEENMGFASELTSCAPGFFASMIEEFVNSALRHCPDFKHEDARAMVLKTMLGTVDFMLIKGLRPDDVITRVATKGGITEEGVKVLNTELPRVFDELFQKTLEKRRIIEEKIRNGLKG